MSHCDDLHDTFPFMCCAGQVVEEDSLPVVAEKRQMSSVFGPLHASCKVCVLREIRHECDFCRTVID